MISFFVKSKEVVLLLRCICVVWLVVFIPGWAFSSSPTSDIYDLVYIWDTDLESVLDYIDDLEATLGSQYAGKLRVVKRADEYGIIYDSNATALDVLQLIVEHGELLREAGLGQAYAVHDTGYDELFNVSYGHGPHLDVLKRTYDKVYHTLGHAVGKELFIEQDGNDYTLIYRRRGDRDSTATVARRHARVLKKKRIATTITPERNHQVVYGESSYLNLLESKTGGSGLADVGESKGKKPRKKEKRPIRKTAGDSPDKALRISPIPLLHAGEYKKRPASAGLADRPRKPLRTVELAASKNQRVEQRVETYIRDLRKRGKLRGDEKTGWMVYDLTRGVILVDINAGQLFQAASMIKPFVALAFFHQVQTGQLKYGPRSRQKMEAMIQRSNNAATNWVMRQVGGPASCQQILLRWYPHLFRQTRIVEYIPAGGRTYRNKVQPSDYVRFLRALWNNELPKSKEMRRLMSLPGRDRLYYGTPIPQGTLVYNKTGTTAHLCGDMGILAPRGKNGRRYPYAIVGVIERDSRPANYGRWIASRGGVIRGVSTLIYKELKKQYRLL
ncbi:MAG: hypothetical protein CSA34_00955 [Desulfobulbus propionicus]|nr:MAG: hypothetical protein CSA34_00955 [Desulfobulbus propionicus]